MFDEHNIATIANKERLAFSEMQLASKLLTTTLDVLKDNPDKFWVTADKEGGFIEADGRFKIGGKEYGISYTVDRYQGTGGLCERVVIGEPPSTPDMRNPIENFKNRKPSCELTYLFVDQTDPSTIKRSLGKTFIEGKGWIEVIPDVSGPVLPTSEALGLLRQANEGKLFKNLESYSKTTDTEMPYADFMKTHKEPLSQVLLSSNVNSWGGRVIVYAYSHRSQGSKEKPAAGEPF